MVTGRGHTRAAMCIPQNVPHVSDTAIANVGIILNCETDDQYMIIEQTYKPIQNKHILNR